MLGLWSRAAQARALCNCPTCLSATARALPRNSQAPLRRQPIRPNTFTVFSSTLALSAAVAHGLTKDQKLQEWDRIVQQTKADIEAVDKEHDARIRELKDRVAHSRIHSAESPETDAPWLGQTSWAEVLEFAEQAKSERGIDGFQNWTGIPLSVLRNLRESDLKRMLSYKWLLHRYYGGADCADLECHTPTYAYSVKKLRTLEWSIQKLVLSFSAPDSSAKESKSPELEDAERRLRQLKSEPENSAIYENFPSPAAPRYQYSPSQRRSALVELNADLEATMFRQEGLTPQDLKKVSDLLLSAVTAPDIHTYNILLVKFCRMRADKLVEATLESLEETHMRPNEITHATILRYHTLTKDKSAFRAYLQRMNGRGQGLSLASPQQSLDPLTRSRFRQFGNQGRKHAELARLNSEVYTCLIKGLIEMFDFREAAWYYIKMINEGWKPTAELLTAMLKHCCDIADMASGWRIWKTMLDIGSTDEKVSQAAYQIMLELCHVCDQFGLYHWVMQQGIVCGALTSDHAGVMNNHSVGAAVATAISNTITLEELQRRFPYVPVEELRQPWKSSWEDLDPGHTLSVGGDFSNVEIYDLMRCALLKPSFAEARSFLRNHTSMPRRMRKTMENKAIWVFGKLQALSSLNAKYAVESEPDSQDDSQEQTKLFEQATKAFDLPKLGIVPQNGLLAAIQLADASVTSKVVLTRYHDFRKDAFEQQYLHKVNAP